MEKTLRVTALACASLLAWVAVVHAARVRAASTAPPFPANNCIRLVNSTSFRVNKVITKELVAQTYCFPLEVQAPANAASKCGLAAQIDKWELLAGYANRYNVTQINIRDNTGKNLRKTGTWQRATAAYPEKLEVGNLGLKPEDIVDKNVRLCLTLSTHVSLEELCLGPQGTCTTSLYSWGAKGAKCCPIFTSYVPVTP